MADVYPLLCEPHLQHRVWGGRRLAAFGKALPADGSVIGEAWEVADIPEGTSGVLNGRLAGRTLHDAVRAWGPALTGVAGGKRRFPLLIKLLDAQEDLSVQVHPDEADCAAFFPQYHGKDETWIVMAAEPDGAIIHGVQPGTTWPDLALAIADGTVFEHLRRVPVQAGDVVRVAPRTVHALLRGVLVLEIQQPSDTTFRLYDYGRGRALHLKESRQVIDFGAPGEPLLAPQRTPCPWGAHELLVDVPAYRIERLHVTEPVAWAVDPVTPQALTVVSGGGTLLAARGDLPLTLGRTTLLPALVGEVRFYPAEPTIVVVAGLGGAPLVALPNGVR